MHSRELASFIHESCLWGVPTTDGYIQIDEAIGRMVVSITELIAEVYPDIQNQ